MSNDALYSSMTADPLSTPVEEVVADEKKSKAPSEKEVIDSMSVRVAQVLRQRAEAYKDRGDQAEESGATATAKTFMAVASELAFLSGKVKAGQIEELEKAGN